MSAWRSVPLHHIVEGPADAPVVVLSNSLGTSLEMWDPQASALSTQFRLIRYDTRGHGHSPVPPGPYDLSDLAADLLALLDRLGIERFHLCGLSLGGLTSMLVAAQAAERVASLTVLSAPVRFPNPDVYRDRAVLVRREGAAAVAAGVVGRWLSPEYAAGHQDVVARLRAMIAATPAEGYAGCCEAVAGADLGPYLDSIRPPTLCVAAAQDPAVAVAEVESLSRLLPAGRLAVVEGAAHLQNIERPAEVTRLIAEHISAVVAAEASYPVRGAS